MIGGQIGRHWDSFRKYDARDYQGIATKNYLACEIAVQPKTIIVKIELCLETHIPRNYVRRDFLGCSGEGEKYVLICNFFHSKRDLSRLTTNLRLVSVIRGQLQFLLKCYLEKRIQCNNYIVFLSLMWYLPSWWVMLLVVANIVLFRVVLVCDRVLWGEIRVITDGTLVYAPNGR